MLGGRLVIKSLLALLVLAGAVPFVLPLRDGKPLLSWSDIKLPKLPVEVPDVSLPADSSSPQEVALYRWRDADGVIQFSNEPPPPGIAFESVSIDPNANIVQPFTAPEPKAGEPGPGQPPQTAQPGSPYSPENVQQLFEDTHKIRETADARTRDLERTLQQR